MQPASDQSGGSGSSSLRRWGPIVAIIAVVAIIAAVVITGGDDEDPETASSSGSTDSASGVDEGATTDVTTPEGDPIYPLSWSEAEEAGLEGLDWGERCDESTGQIATPDAFAPDCFLPFEGDNGGATAPGVTGDTIKIVYYQGPQQDPILNFIYDAIAVDDTRAEERESILGWVEMLDTYYETYGRDVELEFYESTGGAADAVAARADAVKIAEDIEPFMVLGGPILTAAFGEELNARGITCAGCGTGSNEELESRAPNLIATGMGRDQARAHNIAALRNQVANRPAEFAGDEAMHDQDRAFGYIYLEADENSANDAENTRAAMEEAGINLVDMVGYALDPSRLQEQADNAMARFKEAGVTTVIIAGDPVSPREFTAAATEQDYFPEWYINLSALIDTNGFGRTYDQQQWAHAFGISGLPQRVDPKVLGAQATFEWFHGEQPSAEDSFGTITPMVTLLFEVLQETGPNLTRESFFEALLNMEPDEPAITRTSSSWGEWGRWPGLEGRDLDGADDVTKIWWDPEAEGPDEIENFGKGMYRFVDGGKRYLLEDWEEGDFGAFDEDRAGPPLLSEGPEGEENRDVEPLPPRRELTGS